MAEKEYIERGAAMDAILKQPPDAHYPEWYARDIREIPAADVVEVVRCKDCKNYRYEKVLNYYECDIFMGAYEITGYPTKPDDFCSYGERKTE